MTKIYLRSSRRWVALAVIVVLLALTVFAVVTFARAGTLLLGLVPVVVSGVFVSIVARTAVFPYVEASATHLSWQQPLRRRRIAWNTIRRVDLTGKDTVRVTVTGGKDYEIPWRGLAPTDEEAFAALNRARRDSYK